MPRNNSPKRRREKIEERGGGFGLDEAMPDAAGPDAELVRCASLARHMPPLCRLPSPAGMVLQETSPMGM